MATCDDLYCFTVNPPVVPSSSSWPPSDPVGQSVSQLKGCYINGIFLQI